MIVYRRDNVYADGWKKHTYIIIFFYLFVMMHTSEREVILTFARLNARAEAMVALILRHNSKAANTGGDE